MASDDVEQLASVEHIEQRPQHAALWYAKQHSLYAGQLTVVGYLLCPFRQERGDPLSGDISYATSDPKTLQQDRVVHAVKCSGQVEHPEQSDFTSISRHQHV